MEQKIKFIAIILAVLCIVAGGVAYFYYDKHNMLTRENSELGNKNKLLVQQLDDLEKKVTKAEDGFNRLKRDKDNLEKELAKIVSEHDDLKKNYDRISQERNQLTEKLQEALAGGAAQQPETPVQALTSESDEYWAQVLKQKAELELQLSNLKDDIRNNQIKMNEFARDKSNLDLEVEKLTKEKNDIQRQFEYNEKMVDSLTLQLVREKDDKRKIEKHASLFKEENYALRSRLKEVMSNKVALEKKLKDTEDKRMELYGRLNKMDLLLQDRLSEVIDVKQDLRDIRKGSIPASHSAVELSPIVVRSSSHENQATVVKDTRTESSVADTSYSPRQSVARVLSINEENNFVIIDVGENQGVYKGQMLSIYRGEAPIATVEVIQLKGNVCAADIKEKTVDIKAGDIAK